MKTKLVCSTLAAVVVFAAPASVQKPRIFITESLASQASADASAGQVNGSLAFTGGTSPQSVEVIKEFSRRCPGVIVTADRNKAEYVVRLDHDAISPTTPFVHGNKVAVFNKDEDLLYSNATRTLKSAVKDACTAITAALPTVKTN